MSEMTINKYGNQIWLNKAEQCHRLDGPAVIYPNGYQAWCIDGELHRLDGPAVIHPDGTQSWFVNGKCHRLDGPAVIRPNGTQAWYIDGKCHRLDGPAVIHADGTQAWYINGFGMTDQVIDWIKGNDFPGYTLWTDGQRIMFLLAFSGIKS